MSRPSRSQKENLFGFSSLASPLALDLDGDGVEAGKFAFFNHAGNDWAELGGWISEDDGLLAIDRNGNGRIDSGAELFGNYTAVGEGLAANGFSALRQLDSNSDGVINSSDTDWGKLRVFRWSDSDGNNIFSKSSEGRLETLAANGIASLGLAYETSTKVDGLGNEHRQVGSYTRADGTTRDLIDVWFKTVPGMAKYVGTPSSGNPRMDDLMPDVEGSGLVLNLRDAIKLDDAGQLHPPFYNLFDGLFMPEKRTLGQLVTAFVAATEADDRDELAEKILLRWAGAEKVHEFDYWRGLYFGFTHPHKIAVAEAFWGFKWKEGEFDRHPDYSASQEFGLIYLGKLEYLRAQLLKQTTLKDMFDAVRTFHNGVEVSPESIRGNPDLLYTYDYSAVLTVPNAAARNSEFLRSLAALEIGSHQTEIIEALEGVSAEWAYEYQYHIDYLAGMVSSAEFVRKIEIKGNGASNTFRVNGDGPYYRGAGGSDIYQLVRSTSDSIIEEDHYGNNGGAPATDVVKVAPGIARSSVVLSRTGRDLVISLVDSEGDVTNKLRVMDHYVNDDARIERVELGDSARTVYNLEDLAEIPLQKGDGTQGSDYYDASLSSDALDESQRGGMDSDTYLLGRGTGHAVIDEAHRNHRGSIADSIKLMAGLEITDVKLTRHGLDLRIGLYSSLGILTDSLTVKDHYLNIASRVEFLKASDGSRLLDLSAAGSRVKLQNGAVGGIIEGFGGGIADIFGIDAGSDTFRGKAGNDIYELGLGSGNDYIEEGYQNHVAGDSDDKIRLGAGVSSSRVRLRRARWDLVVELFDSVLGRVTDSLTVRDHYRHGRAKVEKIVLHDDSVLYTSADFEAFGPTYSQSSNIIRGTASGESLRGHATVNDVFDSDAGGDDKLYGYGGDDEYRLGSGTGFDVIYERSSTSGAYRSSTGDAGDLIRVEAGYGIDDVRLRRDDRHLWVELLGTAGEDDIRLVTDSLKVDSYFESDIAKIEMVEFSDGTVWGSAEFHAVVLRGGPGNDIIKGRDDLDDIFDSDAGGNDKLYGYVGNDEYRLGSGTGFDMIYEARGYRYYPRDLGDYGDFGDFIRVEAGYGVGDVKLRRDDWNLWVELLGQADENGIRSVTDSLKVVDYYRDRESEIEAVKFSDGTVWGPAEFHAVALRGSSGNEDILGNIYLDDIFDSDAGGNDRLYGFWGDDEYRLGSNTGLDTICERIRHDGDHYRIYGDVGDLIRVKNGYGTSDVQLRRDANHLWVELLGTAGEDGVRPVTDSLKVEHYFESAAAKIETVVFSDGSVWDSAELNVVALRGSAGNEDIHGSAYHNDIFDSDAGGNDRLYGYGGDDEYRLGSNTGSDTIYESEDFDNYGYPDNPGDLIRVESGFGIGDVRLRGDDDHLWVELLGIAGEDGTRSVSDSLKVEDYFASDAAKVEIIEFADGTVWDGSFVVGTNQGDTVTSTTASETLHGGKGDDTYVLSGEFGDDRVVDSGGTDKVQVSGQTSSTLSFSREGDDMVMEVIGSDDRISFDHWYAEGGSRNVERIEVGDKVLLSTAAERMATAMATFITGGGTASDFVSRNHQDYWETISGTPGS